MSYCVATLQKIFVDFDFAASEKNQFTRVNPQNMKNIINARLSPLETLPLQMPEFWKTIDSMIDVKQCRVFSFSANEGFLDYTRPYRLWNVDLFFVNLEQEKIVYFSLFSQNELCSDHEMDDELNNNIQNISL